MLSPLCTDRVVVKSAAVIQGLRAELWASAEKKEKLHAVWAPGWAPPTSKACATLGKLLHVSVRPFLPKFGSQTPLPTHWPHQPHL